MTKKIVETLRQLDPNNDNHWTADGLPKVETVTFMSGETVTRAQITEAAPGFSRANLGAAAPEVTGEAMKASDNFVPSQDGPLVKTELGVVNNDGDLKADGSVGDTNTQGETGAQGGQPEEGGSGEVSEARSWKEHLLATIVDRASAQRAFDQARDAHNQARDALSATQAALDRYIEEDAKSGGPTPLADALSGYFARQQAEREERAHRKEQLKGIPLKDILPKPSPLDEAMKRKNTRGTSRPTRI